jgi:hypothetical protein
MELKMANRTKKKFNWRAFTSLYITFSFIIMTLSGIILFISPAGRIAKWTHLYILGLEKDSWQAIHIIFTFLFIIAGGFHIWYNWKPFVAYLRTKMQQKISLRKELFASFIVTGLLIAFTLLNLPPFSSVIELGEELTDSWSTEQTEPPLPHAESMTFRELGQAIQQSPKDLISKLAENNVVAQPDEIVQDVANRHNLTPMEIFEKMKVVKKSETSNPYAGRGLGRKSMQEICQTVNIDLDKALLMLKEKGFEASAEMKLKDIAAQYDVTPLYFMEIINPGNAGHKNEIF